MIFKTIISEQIFEFSRLARQIPRTIIFKKECLNRNNMFNMKFV